MPFPVIKVAAQGSTMGEATGLPLTLERWVVKFATHAAIPVTATRVLKLRAPNPKRAEQSVSPYTCSIRLLSFVGSRLGHWRERHTGAIDSYGPGTKSAALEGERK